MRKVFTLIFSLLCLNMMAQFPTGGGRPGQGAQNMNMGRFYGRIVDNNTNKGVDAASVQLVQNRFDTVTKKRKDVVVSGQLTGRNGDFNLEGLPISGQFKLKISAIGYKPYEQSVKFELSMNGGDFSQMMNKVDKDLGDIKMEVDSKQLEEVKIVGSKPFMQMGVDRKIFNVEKSLVSTGQTATELMRNIPGVDVDIDGNVSLRNASPTIFVDGRPTTLTLDQIPADAIQSVELITNPSAKFDASGGMAGILNIILKKNRRAGYNGNLRAGIDSRAMVNLGGDINVKQDKVNLFASAMFNQRKSIGEGESFRQELYTTPNILFNQLNENESTGFFGFGRLGMDYFINNRNTITISSNFVRGKFDNWDELNIKTDSIYSSAIKSDMSQRIVEGSRNFQNIGPAIGYKKLFKKSGMELTSDLNMNFSKNWAVSDFNTQYYDNNENPKGFPIKQKQEGSGNSRFTTFQLDYVNPLWGDKAKIEAGLRAAFRYVQNENLNYIEDPFSGDLIPIVAINANFEYNERVLAAYSTYSSKVGKNFSYQLGLRVENSRYDGTLLTNDSSFTNSFPLSFFPSVFVTQKLSDDQDLQFNYSRRINRPNFFQLLPFVDYTDSLNIQRGNPNLVPEFTNSFELNYQKNFKKSHSLLASVYYKHTDDLITRYQVLEPSAIPGRDVIINTYINANSSRAYGFELTSKNPIKSWVEVTTNLNVYNSAINSENLKEDLNNEIWSFFGKMNMNFKLPKNFSIQLSGDYRSRTILPQGGGGGGGRGMGGGGFGGGGGGFGGFVQTTAQGYVNPNYGVDIAIRKEFMKERRGSLTLSMNDLFRTRVYSTYSESEFFTQEFSRRRDWRVVRLNFNWRFGKFDVSLFKRKNVRSGMDGMQEGMNMQ